MTEGFPLGRTEVIAGIDKIVIHIIQDIENGQNHKGKLNVACDKDKGEIRKEQLLRTDSDKFQKLINRAILTKNSDKGISLKEQVNPGWQIFSSFSPFLSHPHGDEHGQDENHTDG